MLSAAVLAPSAKNRQTWRFVVLQGAARMKLARLMEEGAAFVEAESLIFDHVTSNAPDIQSIGLCLSAHPRLAETG